MNIIKPVKTFLSVIIVTSLALHAYTCFVAMPPAAFTIGLFFAAITPYAAWSVAIFRRAGWPLVVACVALPLMLGTDVIVYRETFVSPTSSTAALNLLFAPVSNAAISLIALLIGWLVSKVVEWAFPNRQPH